VSPVDPAGGVSDFLINVVSVGFGLVEVVLVDVGHLGQVRNDSRRDLLVGAVLLVGSHLGLEVLGLEVAE